MRININNAEGLEKAAAKARAEREKLKTEVLVCAGTGCIANGSLEVAESLERAIRKKKLETVSLDRPLDVEEGQIQRDVTDWSTDPRADVMSEELSSVLTRHINELSPHNRIVFVLRDIHGLSTDDTASVLGLSVPAVKSRLHRARLYLRERLSSYMVEGSAAV